MEKNWLAHFTKRLYNKIINESLRFGLYLKSEWEDFQFACCGILFVEKHLINKREPFTQVEIREFVIDLQ